MYFYYFLMAIRCRPKWFNPIFITIIQIVQMVIGIIASCLSFYYYLNDDEGDCFVDKNIIIQGFLMYGSYLYLFCAFFVNRYLKKKPKSTEEKKKA
eukprot:CAMPEP_0178975252 /NCGR_PEP_ID=MMETSP0789-20121207/23023_1 /TAXON_ID=3005 /ORGANISM="Rhizosolenia setigera, Strain CCMP 1694" /LENGTH=95 /DNA_ID=CAMNT_0020663905 /DNA_START=268 /DNA_END=555 /DNA_ORIENTATION=-